MPRPSLSIVQILTGCSLLLGLVVAVVPASGQSEPVADGRAWLSEVETMPFPRQFAQGKLHGQPFKVETADIDQGFLHLVQGDNWITGKLCIALPMTAKEIEDKDFFFDADNPHGADVFGGINKIWENPDGTHTTRALGRSYVVKLHFGKAGNGVIPTYVIIRIDDAVRGERDYVAGFCSVKLVRKP